NDVVLEDGPAEQGQDQNDMEVEEPADEWQGFGDDAEDDVDMDEDGEDIPQFFKDERDRQASSRNTSNPHRKKEGKVAELVREKIRKILEDDTELAEKRARLCAEGDFLKLLYAFNLEGIHFN
ncbi:hypothetical protein LTS18_007381, partial [Coniosporium uncinatum]